MTDDVTRWLPCAHCQRALEKKVEIVDGVTWTTIYCPEHGSVFTSADAGELDLGLIRESDPERTSDFEFFPENFIDHVDSRPPRPATKRSYDWPSLWVWIAIWVVFMATVIGATVLIRDGQDDERRDDSGSQIITSATTPPTVPLATLPLPPLTEPAATSAQATRTEPQIPVATPPAFDPVAYVNGLAYCHACMPPAMEAYRVVATVRGWSEAQIEGRAAFVEIIMATESGGCWNVRRWGYGSIGQDCRTLCMGGRRGECAYDDAGFGQITNILRTPTSPLCAIEHICSPEATVASPWSSMTAYLRVIEDQGKRPWCYLNNSHVRNGHCAKWPG